MKAIPYTPDLANTWNAFVSSSRNGTFLLDRNFMEYHKDRFEDASLLFFKEDDTLCAVLPANARREKREIQSHGGLTYGGLLLSPSASVQEAREALAAAAEHYQAAGFQALRYKPIPHIYHQYPAEEDLYWLFRAQATLAERTISTALDLSSPLSSQLWNRKLKKKACEHLRVEENTERQLPEFWPIVEDVLASRHHTSPVHSLTEITLLAQRFPKNIRLFTAADNGHVVAGCLAFITPTVFHVQYMEAGEEGRQRRALDWLIGKLIPFVRKAGIRFFDFGISTENGGQILNDGLIYQKEGFGGRAVCYDTYEVELEKLSAL